MEKAERGTADDRTVVGIDVGFRWLGWARLGFNGRLEWGLIETPAPPSKRQRRPGELAIADDDAMRSIFDGVVGILDAKPVSLVAYEVPGKGQGARAVEAMAFARAAIVCAAHQTSTHVAQVTPIDVDRAVNPPPLPRMLAPKPPPKGATPETVAEFARLVKDGKKLKEQRRQARKESTMLAMQATFPELQGIDDETKHWSHVCDAAAVLVAEATYGSALRAAIPAKLFDRLVDAGRKGRAR